MQLYLHIQALTTRIMHTSSIADVVVSMTRFRMQLTGCQFFSGSLLRRWPPVTVSAARDRVSCSSPSGPCKYRRPQTSRRTRIGLIWFPEVSILTDSSWRYIRTRRYDCALGESLWILAYSSLSTLAYVLPRIRVFRRSVTDCKVHTDERTPARRVQCSLVDRGGDQCLLGDSITEVK